MVEVLVTVLCVVAYVVGLSVTAGRWARTMDVTVSTDEVTGLGGLWVPLLVGWPLIAACLVIGLIARKARGVES